MNFEIDEFLDHVDQWKFKLHDKLKGMSASQRNTFWSQIHEEARRRGLPVMEAAKAARRPVKRKRRTG